MVGAWPYHPGLPSVPSAVWKPTGSQASISGFFGTTLSCALTRPLVRPLRHLPSDRCSPGCLLLYHKLLESASASRQESSLCAGGADLNSGAGPYLLTYFWGLTTVNP